MKFPTCPWQTNESWWSVGVTTNWTRLKANFPRAWVRSSEGSNSLPRKHHRYLEDQNKSAQSWPLYHRMVPIGLPSFNKHSAIIVSPTRIIRSRISPCISILVASSRIEMTRSLSLSGLLDQRTDNIQSRGIYHGVSSLRISCFARERLVMIIFQGMLWTNALQRLNDGTRMISCFEEGWVISIHELSIQLPHEWGRWIRWRCSTIESSWHSFDELCNARVFIFNPYRGWTN